MPNAFPLRLEQHEPFPGSIVVPGHVLRAVHASISKGEPGACWPYLPRPYNHGQPSNPRRYFRRYWQDPEHGSVSAPVHRLILLEKVGPIPVHLDALHGCGHSWCCNPRHIRAGTPVENAADLQRHRLERLAALAGQARPRFRTTPVCLAA